MTTKSLLLACEASRILGMTTHRFRRLDKLGQGPLHILLPDGEVRYDPDDLWNWVRTLKQPQEGTANAS